MVILPKIKGIMPYARVIIFLALALCIEYVHAGAWSYRTDGIAQDQFSLIEQSKRHRSEETLIMGDSVAAQLFGNDKKFKNAYAMTGNCSATMGGYYILLRNYIQANPQTKTVLMVISPDLIANAADMDYTYQYYVVPYYNEENIKYITDDMQEYIDERFGLTAARFEPLKAIVYNDIFMLAQYRNYIMATRPKERVNMRISRLSAVYLRQIKNLCAESGIELKVMSCPLQNNRAMHTWSGFESDIKKYGLEDILSDYSSDASYYDEKYFSDEYHFENEYLNKSRPVLIRNLLKNGGY